MNKEKIYVNRSQLSRKIIRKSILALLVWCAFIILVIIFCKTVFHTTIWYEYQTEWRILHWLNIYSVPLAAVVIGLGLIVICIWNVHKVLKFLDEIISESIKLASPESGQIRLSVSLNDVQNKMNQIREDAMKSAADAKEAEQRKNDLIVYLAHDLKTPLTSVIGYLTLLRDEPQISAELRTKYTGVALDKAERLEMLINEFFDITRFNLTQISLEFENVNLTRLIEQTAYEFKPILAEKGLFWDLSVSDNIYLKCDADKIARVIDNIIRNAVNYSYPDTCIKLDLRKIEKSVVFSVENKGKTISSEKLDRIFEQFFRIDSSRGTGTGGAGLGLAIAKEITELHGGTITAVSSNETIRFTVILPL